jgi:hypothetical protein
MFQQTTSLSNWLITQLALLDVRRTPEEPKLPTMPTTYLYPKARAQFPSLPPQTVSTLEQTITAKYRAKRYEVIWVCKSSLPNFRYPQPYPVPNQSWAPEMLDGRPVVRVRIGDRHFRLRLKGGPRFRRQAAAFKQSVSGEAQLGQLALYERGPALMCQMCAWLPRRPAGECLSGTLFVRTSATSIDHQRKSLLTALNDKDEHRWNYHADQLPRWAAEHRERLRRWANDSKTEARPIVALAERRQVACFKYHNRLNTACDQAAAYLCNYVSRRRLASVVYDDSDKSFFPEFVWQRLSRRLSTILGERGIDFRLKSAGDTVDEVLYNSETCVTNKRTARNNSGPLPSE